MTKPPQLTQRNTSSALRAIWISKAHPISKTEPSNPTEETYFVCLYSSSWSNSKVFAWKKEVWNTLLSLLPPPSDFRQVMDGWIWLRINMAVLIQPQFHIVLSKYLKCCNIWATTASIWNHVMTFDHIWLIQQLSWPISSTAHDFWESQK